MSNNTGAGIMPTFFSIVGAILAVAAALLMVAIAIAAIIDRFGALNLWLYNKAYLQCRKDFAISLNSYAWHFSDNPETVLAFRIMAKSLLTDRSLEDAAKTWQNARKDPDHAKAYF